MDYWTGSGSRRESRASPERHVGSDLRRSRMWLRRGWLIRSMGSSIGAVSSRWGIEACCLAPVVVRMNGTIVQRRDVAVTGTREMT